MLHELKSPKLINGLGKERNHRRQLSQPERNDASLMLQLLQRVQPVEIVKTVNLALPKDSRKKSQSVLYLSEDEAEYKLIEILQRGINDYTQGKAQQALFHFKQAEQILTAFPICPRNYYLIIKINLGVCYYNIGWHENAFTSFEDAILSFKKHARIGQEGFLLNTMRMHCYLQCCIILSEIGQHQEAFNLAKIAVRKGLKLLFHLHDFLENVEMKQFLEEILKKSAGLQQLKSKYLQLLISYPINNQIAFDSIFQDCSLEYQQQANILSFIQMNPINLQSFAQQLPFPSKEQFLHMICLFVIALYCTSTESRFIEIITEPYQFTEAENYLSRALEIVFVYFPKEMPLINQLLNVHTRFHDLSKQIIHEDNATQVPKPETTAYDVVLLKPLVEANKFGFAIPIIRKSKCPVLLKERAKSLKEAQFQTFSTKKPQILELKTFEQRSFKKRLRSISTTNKGKPNSPKWNQAADVYLQKPSFRQTHFKRPSTKTYNNKTVDIVKQQSMSHHQPSSKLQQEKKFNINFLFINNLNHINLRQRKKSTGGSHSNNLDQLLKTGSIKSGVIQSKIKNLIKSYQI